MVTCNRIARALAVLALAAWMLGGLAVRLHDLRAFGGHPVVGADCATASAPDEGAAISAEHHCPLDDADLTSPPEAPPVWRAALRVRTAVRADRAPAAPRGPPPLTFAPKTDPPVLA